MHLPSRGLRLSATTMRKAGVFFAPIRFIRILTDINESTVNESTANESIADRDRAARAGLKNEGRGYGEPTPLASPFSKPEGRKGLLPSIHSAKRLDG